MRVFAAQKMETVLLGTEKRILYCVIRNGKEIGGAKSIA